MGLVGARGPLLHNGEQVKQTALQREVCGYGRSVSADRRENRGVMVGCCSGWSKDLS